MARGVVFDLWQTLVPWPTAEGEALRRAWSGRLGVSLEELAGSAMIGSYAAHSDTLTR